MEMDGYRCQQFLNKLLPLRFSPGRIDTSRAVRQLNQRPHGDAHVGLTNFASDSGKLLPGVLGPWRSAATSTLESKASPLRVG
jgi:hypothetical protein